MRGRHALELVHVAQHPLAALRVELRDAVGLDVLLAGEPELLLDGELDRQAVAVPAGPAGDVPPLHRLEAREQVLEHARLDVVRPRLAVRGRRALVEDPRLAAGGLLQAALEDAALLPAREHRALERRAGRPGRAAASWVVLRRGCSDGGTRPSSGPAVPPSLGLAPPLWSCSRHRACTGLMFTRGHAAGLPPSPVRSGLRPRLLVPAAATVPRLPGVSSGLRRCPFPSLLPGRGREARATSAAGDGPERGGRGSCERGHVSCAPS